MFTHCNLLPMNLFFHLNFENVNFLRILTFGKSSFNIWIVFNVFLLNYFVTKKFNVGGDEKLLINLWGLKLNKKILLNNFLITISP